MGSRLFSGSAILTPATTSPPLRLRRRRPPLRRDLRSAPTTIPMRPPLRRPRRPATLLSLLSRCFSSGDDLRVDESNSNQDIVTVGDRSVHDQSYKHAPFSTDTNEPKLEDGEIEGYVVEESTPNEPTVDTESFTNGLPENLPPPDVIILCF
ncbi:hypothetical protein LXL04_018102 [Taraxacum kok-saghyz]